MNTETAGSVFAVVVTYNRPDMLAECLDALGRVDGLHTVVVDNASTDSTWELLSERSRRSPDNLIAVRLKGNLGGAGGFYWGMRIAMDRGAKWLWLMDDDVVPQADCYAALEQNMNLPDIGFLCSCVRDPDGTMSMNTPIPVGPADGGAYPQWDRMLASGIALVSSSTFVSVMFPRSVVEEIGYPLYKYFIWGDDSEYTTRALTGGRVGYCIGGSVVVHKRASPTMLNIIREDNAKRIPMYYYLYRNNLYSQRRQRGGIGSYLFSCARDMVAIILRAKGHKLVRIWAIFKGVYAGLSTDLENKTPPQESAVETILPS